MERSLQALVVLRQIIRATEIHEKNISRSTGLTLPQLMVLQTLRESSPMTSGELARRLNVAQATVTSILDRLEKKTLISRERGKEDKRKMWVHLTDEGTHLLVSSPTTLQDRFTQEFDDMRDWEQSMMLASLERIAHLLQADHLDAAPVLNIGRLDRAESHQE
jgi:DNA-binding MarR family transcriptional regulator